MNAETAPKGGSENSAGGRVQVDSLTGAGRSHVAFQPMPPLSPDQYDALREDIAENGVITPVITDQHGRILDGNNRVEIATALGIDYPVVIQRVADDQDAEDRAVTLNCARRHLTREQRREVVRNEIRRRPDDSDRAIARRVGCDHKTVGSVRRGELPHLPGTRRFDGDELKPSDVHDADLAIVEDAYKRLWRSATPGTARHRGSGLVGRVRRHPGRRQLVRPLRGDRVRHEPSGTGRRCPVPDDPVAVPRSGPQPGAVVCSGRSCCWCSPMPRARPSSVVYTDALHLHEGTRDELAGLGETALGTASSVPLIPTEVTQ